MMKKYVKSVWVFLVIGSIVCAVIVLGIQIIGGLLKNPLEKILPETDSIPYYVEYGFLHMGDMTIPIGMMCKEENEEYCLGEIFCIEDQEVYFLYYSYINESYYWAIASVNIETLQFQTHCIISDPQEKYGINFTSGYEEKNGYYWNKKIVLNDRNKIWEYDIDSKKLKESSYDNYVFPQNMVSGKCVNSETIQIKVKDLTHTYTLKEMAEKSNGISQICKLKNEVSFLTNSSFYDFFSESSVQVVNKKIYAIGQLFNSTSHAFLVILQYDEQNDRWLYVTSDLAAMGDFVHGKCYVVP